MDHPLVHEDQKDLRKRVVAFVKSGYRVERQSNLVFVCGGNDAEQMRPRFVEYCQKTLDRYDVFQPESAMQNLFAGGVTSPFDITDFETLVGELSHAIVIFPEAPGSYAETGYFSAIPMLAERSILVSNIDFQATDSFISLGPAKKFAQQSKFGLGLQADYNDPNFEVIIDRIRSIAKVGYKKQLSLTKFSEISAYDLSCAIYCVVKLLSIATFEDIIYLLRSIFRGKLSVQRVQHITSILVGAGYFFELGEFGHLAPSKARKPLVEVMDGRVGLENELRLALANVYMRAEQTFASLVENSRDAH